MARKHYTNEYRADAVRMAGLIGRMWKRSSSLGRMGVARGFDPVRNQISLLP